MQGERALGLISAFPRIPLSGPADAGPFFVPRGALRQTCAGLRIGGSGMPPRRAHSAVAVLRRFTAAQPSARRRIPVDTGMRSRRCVRESGAKVGPASELRREDAGRGEASAAKKAHHPRRGGAPEEKRRRMRSENRALITAGAERQRPEGSTSSCRACSSRRSRCCPRGSRCFRHSHRA